MTPEAAVADALVVLHREGLLRPRNGILEEAAYLVGIEVSELRAAQQRAMGDSPPLSNLASGLNTSKSSRATVPPSRGEGTRPARQPAASAPAAPSPDPRWTFSASRNNTAVIARRGLHERSLDYKRCESCQELKAFSCFYKDDDKWCRSCTRKFTRKAEERYRKSLCPRCGGELACTACGGERS